VDQLARNRISAIDGGTITAPGILQARLPDSRVVRAFSMVDAPDMSGDGHPKGDKPKRRALALAGDDAAAKRLAGCMTSSGSARSRQPVGEPSRRREVTETIFPSTEPRRSRLHHSLALDQRFHRPQTDLPSAAAELRPPLQLSPVLAEIGVEYGLLCDLTPADPDKAGPAGWR